jgi:hypothetical protein
VRGKVYVLVIGPNFKKKNKIKLEAGGWGLGTGDL